MHRPLRTLILLFAATTLGCATADDSNTDRVDQTVACPDTPAPGLFQTSVCICEDFIDVGNLLIGTAVEGDQASLGVNGETVFANNAEIRGDFVGYGGVLAATNLEVGRDLASAGSVGVIGRVAVGRDMDVGSNLSGAGVLNVDGALRVAGNNNFLGFGTIGSVESYGTTPEPPCGCDRETFFDVAGAVARARAQNDNALAGLGTSLSTIGARSIQLNSGSYYFNNLDNIGLSRVVIDGTVAMYVDGSLNSVGAEQIKLAPGATLDLYVSGAVQNVGHISLGDKQAPSSFRLYIGGQERVTVSVGNNLFNGAIYAPEAELHYVGNTNIRGAVFAKTITGVGNLVVGYAAPHDAPETCEPPAELPDEDDEDDDEEEEEDPPIIVL